VVFILVFTIYSNWLWLTVAADYLLEGIGSFVLRKISDLIFVDYLKHPTAILIKERLSNGYKETKKLTGLSLKYEYFFLKIFYSYLCRYGEEFVRSTITNIEPYAIKFGQYLQKQWNILLKYIEGPIYDKTIEIAEQVRFSGKYFLDNNG
jgi:hypothetical protein